jgi:hypothetical protein
MKTHFTRFLFVATLWAAIVLQTQLAPAQSTPTETTGGFVIGCVGIAATVSPTRSGDKALLIELTGLSGGIITTVGLPCFLCLIEKPSGRFVGKLLALNLRFAQEA